ncbi:hypothetical protein [Agromyces bracchium]|uniref:Uncharacterized protein n=1 Tax=Agromyces bracchium TaxID=88376 RepID=A0A6I3MIH0_9MICO|nr:hypothetical protein [Agromyces bracchium]MTH70113.1 hypothetical protein [Agromyces bracchium]
MISRFARNADEAGTTPDWYRADGGFSPTTFIADVATIAKAFRMAGPDREDTLAVEATSATVTAERGWRFADGILGLGGDDGDGTS